MIPAADLYPAIATRLHTAGVGVWKTSGMYADSETGIVIKRMPATPHTVITLTLYDRPMNFNPRFTHERLRLQARVRTPTGRVIDVDTLAEKVTAALIGDHMDWSGIPVTKCHRASYLPVGEDSNGRPEISMNFELILPR